MQFHYYNSEEFDGVEEAPRTTMTIMRGLPGSGKSTKAKKIAAETGAIIVSADNFFVGHDGVYRFEPSRIGDAHASCYEGAVNAVTRGNSVIVDNTNTQKWEFQKYVELSIATGMVINIVTVYDGGLSDEALARRNTHDVPVEAIARMRARWEP